MKNVLYLTRRFTGFVVFILSLNQLCGAASNITPDSYPGACSIQISTNTTSLCAGDTAIINVISSDISITCSTVTYSWQSSDNLTQWMNQPVTGETFSYVGASSGKKYFRALVSDCANCMGNGPVYSDTLTLTFNSVPVVTINGPKEVCVGADTKLEVSETFQSYAWSTGATNQSITLPTNSFSIINYSVTVTDVNLCKASDTAKVEVRNLPTVTISGEDKFCEGGQTTLTANLSGGFESSPLIWQWNDGSTTQNFQTSTSLTAANYTYAVTVSQNQNPGCSNSTTSMISVYPMPTFTLSTDDTNICTGGASSFSVSNIMGGVPGNPIKYTHSFNGTLAGEFTNSFTTQMIVNPGPIYIKVEADQDIFIGDGCTSQQLVTVQVSTDPVLTISGATNVCQGNSVNLTSSVTGGVQGGELYTWKRLSGTNETTLSDTDSQYTTDNTLLPGSYNYVVSVSQSAKGCASAPVTVSADVVSQPMISIGIAQGASSEICLGGSVKLLAYPSGGINCTIQWQSSSNGTDWTSITGAENQEYSASPAVEGSTFYRATTVNCAGSCTAANSNAIEIKVRPDPRITAITASPNQICKGGQSVITVQTNGGGAGNCSINWDWKDNSGNWIGTGMQGNQLAVDNNTPFYGTQTSGVRNYRAMISCTGAGCDADNSTTALTIKEDLTVQVVPPNSTAVCQNLELKLNGEYMGGVDNCTTLTWEKAIGNGPFVEELVSNSYTVNTATPGIYRYRVIAKCIISGCEPATSAPIEVRIKPTIPVLAAWPQQDPPLCEGVQSYTLDARPLDQYSNPTYEWASRTSSSMNWQNIAVSSGTFNTGLITKETQYKVIVKTECGSTEKQITVRILPQPDTKILDGPSNVCTGQTAFYRIQSPVSLIDDQADIQWSIVPSTGGVVVDSFNHNAGVVIKWEKQGTYLLKAKHTRENCTGEDQIQVTVINPGGTKLIASPIHHYAFNNLLIHTDSSASCYQWYRYDRLNNATEIIAGEQYQAYAASAEYDPVRYAYFAKAWIGNCENEPSCAVVSYEVEDKDGFSPDTYNELSVYPNPNNGYFNIQASDMPQNVVVSVTDINGRKVYEETVDCPGGLLLRTVSIQEPSAVYLLTVRNFNQPGYQRSLRFVIAN